MFGKFKEKGGTFAQSRRSVDWVGVLKSRYWLFPLFLLISGVIKKMFPIVPESIPLYVWLNLTFNVLFLYTGLEIATYLFGRIRFKFSKIPYKVGAQLSDSLVSSLLRMKNSAWDLDSCKRADSWGSMIKALGVNFLISALLCLPVAFLVKPQNIGFFIPLTMMAVFPILIGFGQAAKLATFHNIQANREKWFSRTFNKRNIRQSLSDENVSALLNSQEDLQEFLLHPSERHIIKKA